MDFRWDTHAVSFSQATFYSHRVQSQSCQLDLTHFAWDANNIWLVMNTINYVNTGSNVCGKY